MAIGLTKEVIDMAEKKVQAEKKSVVTAGVYDILRRPIVSEKAVPEITICLNSMPTNWDTK